jgi:NAD(P)-dependent dehydrogenase (short-subunit alcohol dehydrogenase family)
MSQPSFQLQNKTALITGGTSGIGLVTAKRFVEHGARVVITGRRASGFETAKEIGAEFIPADLTKPDEIKAMVEQAAQLLDGIDVLISNAGVAHDMILMEDTSDEILQETFDVNFLGPYKMIRDALPLMNDGGSILLNSSFSGMSGIVGETHYGSAKAALIYLAKALAVELTPRNIRVNCVSPGSQETAMWPDDHPQKKLLATVHPMGRLGNPEEVAAAFHFLAADDCGFITGHNLAVDGGLSAGFSMQLLDALMDT